MRKYLTINILRIIYFALCQSVIQYGILGWCCASNTNLTPLNLLHKTIIIICLHKPIDYPTDELFKEFKVFNIRQILVCCLKNSTLSNNIHIIIVPKDWIHCDCLNLNVIQPLHLTTAASLVPDYITNLLQNTQIQ